MEQVSTAYGGYTAYNETGVWRYWAFTFVPTSGSRELKIYKDGISQSVTIAWNDFSGDTIYNSSQPLRIGSKSNGDWYVDGKIDEVRISSVKRSAAWIKASYHTENDTLLTYGSEETSGKRRIIITE